MPTRLSNIRALLLSAIFCALLATTFPAAADQWVYFGTYTSGISKGIQVSRLTADGQLTPPELVAPIANPSFLAVDSKNQFLYAASEVAGAPGKKRGEVAAYALDAKTGKLTEINRQPSGGETLCHISVAADKTVLVASYGGGNISALPLNRNGGLEPFSSFVQHRGSSVNPRNQTSPHAHQIVPDPTGQFALVCDLGLDKVLLYRLDAKNSTLSSNAITAASLKPGNGPRHLAFHPNGKFAYVINEMGCSVTGFEFDSTKGALKEIQTITTLPEGQAADASFSGAQVVAHPSGKFLYASTRGLNLINVFSVDEKSGRLTHVENISSGGKTPRNFNVDPSGKFLLAANQNSDSVVVFKINPADGHLTPTGQTLTIGNPSCVVFVPAN